MWMKYFNRILYALVAALGILIVYNLTDSAVKSKELTERAADALSAEDYDYFVSVRFYRPEPIEDVVVASGDATYRILVYDAAYIRMEDENYTVVDGLVWLMVQTAGTPIDNYFDIRYLNDEETVTTRLGFRIFDFPLFSGMDQNSTATLVKRSDLFSNEGVSLITSIELWVGDERRLVIPVDIDETDFATKDAIEGYMTQNGDLPEASFGEVAMSDVIVIDTTGPAVRNILIYVGVVALLTYLLFKYREKRLGRKPPTPGVQKDIERLQATKQEKQ